MKFNKTAILALLIALSVLVGPVSAVDIYLGDNNTVIQEKINNASAGENVTFETGNYDGISLTVTKDNLTFLGNGATLVGSGSSIFTITNRTGLTIKDFFININSTTGGDGITGSNVYNTTIKNNVITNGDDGINIFMQYGGLKIIGNTITNMTTGRDGISLVNHNVLPNLDSLDKTIIKNNIIDDVQYGIFLGGNFKGFIIGNDVTGTVAALNITGKRTADNGKLNATICDNIINGGIAMEAPEILFLKLCYNTIGEVVGTGYSILTGGSYGSGGVNNIFVTFNEFSHIVDPAFRIDVTLWSNNTLNGLPYP